VSGRPRKLTEEQELELVAWWRLEKCAQPKAQAFGISVETFFNVLRRRGALPMKWWMNTKDRQERAWRRAEAMRQEKERALP
jgi:hypothetical protein